MDISRRQLIALHADGLALPRIDDKPTSVSWIRIAGGSASPGSMADMAASGHPGGVHS